MKRFIVAAAAAMSLLGVAPAAHAATFEFGMEDEGLLLSNPQSAPPAVAAWQKLGVDVVRIHARWWEIAPAQTATTKPAGFDAANPASPGYDWVRLDQAVQLVRANNIRVMLTITGPGPLWSSSQPAKRNPRWKPDPKAFADFSKAVATRYKSQVDRYLLWNEPNQKGWLQPQWERVSGKFQAVSPHVYRGLVRAAQPVVKAADPGAEVVIGELAPVGNRPISADTPMRPLPFLRSMGCVDDNYRSVRSGRCKGFKAAKGDTLGYHPHPKKYAPDRVNNDLDSAQFGDLKRLFTAIDKLRARKAISISKTIHLTEYGYETSPPDPASGVSTALQTKYLQQAAYIAWATKRVRGLSFYQWGDEPVRNLGSGTKRYSGWQTGLLYNDGQPKPVLSVMPAPFVIDQAPGARSAVLWGHVRGEAQGQVTIMVRPKGSSEFTDVQTLNIGADGVWSRKLTPQAGAAYRYEWTPKPTLEDPNPQPRVSGIVDLAKTDKSRYKAAVALAAGS
ncbi:cellulase family glycosylhydrolase [Solirubrobacter sp. CPCC 204708]|uniref:Cellulase family glycosylhydrolase n=1 Tax=Solirubrobacter deserti TaxID=2282478 RepID=A0ABT4RS07_9ACTN|nr:cellulase family glycosylhydrolase [Solirubrobacter deserti]MBE2315126.1 cellulase family glycosylhydrolase [Solirubrobacter deserti]MDA0141352.1 cellulase family glycosylhydrolase [Solirubrobacter deserti]